MVGRCLPVSLPARAVAVRGTRNAARTDDCLSAGANVTRHDLIGRMQADDWQLGKVGCSLHGDGGSRVRFSLLLSSCFSLSLSSFLLVCLGGLSISEKEEPAMAPRPFRPIQMRARNG